MKVGLLTIWKGLLTLLDGMPSGKVGVAPSDKPQDDEPQDDEPPKDDDKEPSEEEPTPKFVMKSEDGKKIGEWDTPEAAAQAMHKTQTDTRESLKREKDRADRAEQDLAVARAKKDEAKPKAPVIKKDEYGNLTDEGLAEYGESIRKETAKEIRAEFDRIEDERIAVALKGNPNAERIRQVHRSLSIPTMRKYAIEMGYTEVTKMSSLDLAQLIFNVFEGKGEVSESSMASIEHPAPSTPSPTTDEGKWKALWSKKEYAEMENYRKKRRYSVKEILKIYTEHKA